MARRAGQIVIFRLAPLHLARVRAAARPAPCRAAPRGSGTRRPVTSGSSSGAPQAAVRASRRAGFRPRQRRPVVRPPASPAVPSESASASGAAVRHGITVSPQDPPASPRRTPAHRGQPHGPSDAPCRDRWTAPAPRASPPGPAAPSRTQAATRSAIAAMRPASRPVGIARELQVRIARARFLERGDAREERGRPPPAARHAWQDRRARGRAPRPPTRAPWRWTAPPGTPERPPRRAALPHPRPAPRRRWR